MKIKVLLDRNGRLFTLGNTIETRRVTETDRNGKQADVPKLMADMVYWMCVQDWADGYDGLDTRIYIETSDFNDPPLGAECCCIYAKTGQFYHFPCVITTDWIWWTKGTPRWFLFIESKKDSKHNFVQRTLTICYKN